MKYKKKYSIGAIILSRYDSSRLPGKALIDLGGKPLIKWPIDAFKKITELEVVVATTDRLVDNPIADFAYANKIKCFRGDTSDIAKRIIDCAENYAFDYVFRVNGDSPFISIQLLKQALSQLDDKRYDFVTNLIDRTFPYGLSCELIKIDTFKQFYPQFTDFQKEHITNFYYKNLKEVTFTSLKKLSKDLSNIDWAIDTYEDLKRVNKYLRETQLTNFESLDIETFIYDYQTITNKHLND